MNSLIIPRDAVEEIPQQIESNTRVVVPKPECALAPTGEA